MLVPPVIESQLALTEADVNQQAKLWRLVPKEKYIKMKEEDLLEASDGDEVELEQYGVKGIPMSTESLGPWSAKFMELTPTSYKNFIQAKAAKEGARQQLPLTYGPLRFQLPPLRLVSRIL